MPKQALVTGSSGFVGRHMNAELTRRGWMVTGIDIADKIDDNDDVNTWLQYDLVRYDLVVHCAYHVGGRAAIDGTNTNFAKNVQLDGAMFEWAVRTGQRRVLYFSSSAAYPVRLQTPSTMQGVAEWTRLKEHYIDLDDVSQPDANYGWAKITGEMLARDARRNGCRVTVVRPFSGYGEDQSDVYPFPSIIRRAQKNDLSVWGPPGQTRDWIHIDDVVQGALAVVDSETELPVNLCTGVGTEMGDLMQMAYQMGHEDAQLGPETPPIIYDIDKPTGVYYRVGNPDRFNQFYKPKVTLEEGIARALAVIKAS